MVAIIVSHKEFLFLYRKSLDEIQNYIIHKQLNLPSVVHLFLFRGGKLLNFHAVYKGVAHIGYIKFETNFNPVTGRNSIFFVIYI